ncbi:Nucleoporin NUP57 like protein [Verticillium longisporum]|uniref:Nucleoporin NUP57 like protein n=1 Tax=Verticillium longisporum TaxID=100787 RepID=A0A8I2Z9N7_VERLO|nr:Nucleoporin NUP57 like protein [Verticillium longisporum]
MSLFGKPVGQNGGLFGASTFGQSQQQQQPQQQQQAAPTLSLFGGQQNQTNHQQNQGTSSLFGGSFAQPQQPQQQQQQQQQQQVQQSQQQQMPSLAQSQAQLSSSLWQPGSETPQNQKPPREQIATTFRKWHPGDPSCVFRHYFYNKVDNAAVPFYQPGPNEDPKEWEEALQRKPGQGYIPVLGAGFSGVADRLQTQKRVVGEHNVRLHQINASLDAILSRHDLETSVRALAARRRHVALRERCLALAARVQVLRNRGYALSGDEDDLRLKLVELDRAVQDPALSAREEELWSRLIVLRGYADQLMKEVNKPAATNGESLSEETELKVKKVLEDYEKQIQHLKKEVETITKDFQEWESDGAAR